MKMTCYKLEKDAYLFPVPCPDVSVRATDEDEDYWIEIEEASAEDLASLIKGYQTHPLMVEDILEPDHSTLLDRYPKGVYLEFPLSFDEIRFEINYLSIILTSHRITTIRRGEVPAMEELIRKLKGDVRFPRGDTSDLLYLILDFFVDRNLFDALQLRKEVASMEKAFTRDSGQLDATSLLKVKTRVRELMDPAEDQHFCVTALNKEESLTIDFGDDKAYLRDLKSDSNHVLRILKQTEKRVADLGRNYQMSTHERTDKRLRLLTIISSILLPMTLLTGYFGMNFTEMPMIQWNYGFFVVVIFMFAILLVEIWFFYRNGWFE